MSDNPLRIVVTGRGGRMGSQVIEQVGLAPDLVLSGAVDQGESFDAIADARRRLCFLRFDHRIVGRHCVARCRLNPFAVALE